MFGELKEKFISPVEKIAQKWEEIFKIKDAEIDEKIKETLSPQEAAWLQEYYRRFFEFEKGL